MFVILVLTAVILGVGLLLYAEHRRYLRRNADAPAAMAVAEPEECCGQHATCERDSLLAEMSPTIEYYDDEELDRYAGRGADSYNDTEAEEFRDVLLTMPNDNIAGWARSLQLRGINLPADVRDELLMIVSENRLNA